jgi:hypothetical protein
VTWDDVEADHPNLLDCTNWVAIDTYGKIFIVKTLLNKGVVESISDDEIYALNLQIKELPRLERKRSRKSGSRM